MSVVYVSVSVYAKEEMLRGGGGADLDSISTGRVPLESTPPPLTRLDANGFEVHGFIPPPVVQSRVACTACIHVHVPRDL